MTHPEGMFLLVFIVTFGIALLAQWHVKRMYARHSRTQTLAGYSGAEVAGEILRQSGIYDVSIVEQSGILADHYDPTHKRLVLSSDNYPGHPRLRWVCRPTNAAMPSSTRWRMRRFNCAWQRLG